MEMLKIPVEFREKFPGSSVEERPLSQKVKPKFHRVRVNERVEERPSLRKVKPGRIKKTTSK